MLLDLGERRRRRAAVGDEPAHTLEVLRAFDERDGDPVDAVIESEREVFEIAVGDRREGERSVRIVQALLRAQRAADLDVRRDAVAFDRLDAQPDRAVGEIQRVADANVARQSGVVDGDAFGRSRDLLRREKEVRVVRERDRVEAGGEWARADLRAGQILHQRDVHVQLARQFAHALDRARVIRVRAVREVQPEDVDAREQQRAQRREFLRRGPDRGDDLRPFERELVHDVASRSQRAASAPAGAKARA